MESKRGSRLGVHVVPTRSCLLVLLLLPMNIETNLNVFFFLIFEGPEFSGSEF